MSKKKKTNEAGWLRVLTDYMQCYTPASELGPDVELKSTDEIINDLQSMADMTPNDVADTLSVLGYHSYHDRDGRHGWLLKHVK